VYTSARKARRIAGWRFDLDAAAVDYLDDTSWVTVPTLVFHGTDDRTVPFELARRLASAAPDLVQLELVDGAEHVEAWNLDPAHYDRTVREFLTPFA
jgi:fermentation-respiration switch protein FrsA (DUF1100 family)